jgi:hypothetical protein
MSNLSLSRAALLLALPLAAALLLSRPVPAFAQEERHRSRAEAERTMAEYARCVVGKERKGVERFVRLVPGQPETLDAAVGLATPNCMPRSFLRVKLRFQADLFRASLFTAMYQHDFRRTPPADLASIPPLVIASEFDAPERAIPEGIFYSRAMGDCAARADARDVHSLLMTRIASAAERPALDKVMPALRNCLPAGRELRFSRSMLRGLLAEALYKLRRSAPAPAPAHAARAGRGGR